MVETGTVNERVETIRTQTIEILTTLQAKIAAFELPQPEPPALLENYRQKLLENTYKVLVAGEAKRGKSSFINALIGSNILPTDVDVATCQVFYIRRAPSEGYRLRFEDNSTQEIMWDDLPKYGQQSIIDLQQPPSLNQIIRWIEIDMPGQFLMKGIHILDTPGLGSLYAAHAQITQRFVPYADAVIYVLDSSKPIIQTELEFIDTLLGVTKSIFFVQTKIDLHRKNHWQSILQRNQEILRERFQGKIDDLRVWPISSTNLIKATQSGDEDFLLVSRYRQLAAVLQIFLFRIAGWERSAAALRAAENYYALACKTLAGRLRGITLESEQQISKEQQRIAERRRDFDRDWGPHGQLRLNLLDSLRQAANAGKQSFYWSIQSGNEFEQAQREKIDTLSTYEAANAYAKEIDGKIIGAIFEQWNQACKLARTRCEELLEPFIQAANTVSFGAGTMLPSHINKHGVNLNIQQNWGQALDKASIEGDLLGSIANIFLPGIWAAAAALIWTGIRTFFLGRNARLQEAKAKLHERLTQLLQTIQQHFLGIDINIGAQSLVDSYFNSLVQVATEEVQRIALQKSDEAHAEIERLSVASRLDEQQRQNQAARLQSQLDELETIHKAILDQVMALNVLDQSLKMNAPTDLIS